ncbi:MAG: transglutaminase domain-containing protein [candidate division Zixibacteria bacterium]|nr:transglutaminase domain-containing protein [Candidatus Tariuqbacter arcticus]
MNSRHILIFVLLAMLLPLISAFGEEIITYPPEVTEALEAAGDNRIELEKAISHYTSGDDSLKLQALFYLMTNIKEKCYVTYDLLDSAGTQIDFNVLDYPDFNTMKAYCDSLEAQQGELDFKKKEKIYDSQTITADFLIIQIDYAFRAWREKPWAKELSFDSFCEYVLPYRGSSEPLESWREYFWLKYEDIEDKMTDSSNPIEAVCIINDNIKSWFSFDSRFYYHPTDQGMTEMLENRMGRCEDMTNLTIYAMRANGLAVTSDYTPYWANTGNNHAWNAIVTPEGKVIPFMGAESNPGKYRLTNKLAKVYRKMFSEQKGNLAFQERKQEKMPGYISGKSYIDVTADYVDVCDVTIPLAIDVSDSANIAYLCVFNSGEWKAIHWGKISDGKVVFSDMGLDIAYLPALYIDEEIVPFANPFILHTDSSIQELQPKGDNTISARLISTTRRKQEISTDGIEKVFLTPGQEYELFYWQDGWQSFEKSAAGEEPLVFHNVPEGCLYWLVAEGSDKEERIFAIEDGNQVWW